MMGFLNKVKQKNESDSAQKKNSVIISMPMFNSDKIYALDKVINGLKSYWNLDITELSGDDSVAIFNIENETVAIAFMPAPICLLQFLRKI